MWRSLPSKAATCATGFLLALAGLLLFAEPATAQDPCIYGCVDPPDPNTPPLIPIDPPDGDYGSSVTVEIEWCDDEDVNDFTREIKLNGTDITPSFSYVSGGDTCGHHSSTGTINVQEGDNTLSATICDFDSECTTLSRTYSHHTYTVSVTPDGQNVSVSPNGSKSVSYTVHNTGSGTATYDLTQNCTNTVSSCSLSDASVTLGSGASTTVTQTFDVGGGNTSGQAKLKATKNDDSSWSNWGSHDVSVPHSYSVDVTPDWGSITHDGYPSASETTYDFTVQNTGTGDATYDLTVYCDGTVNPGSCSAPNTVDVSGGGSKAVTVDYGVSASSEGEITLEAVQSGQGSVVDSGAATVSLEGVGVMTPGISGTTVDPNQYSLTADFSIINFESALDSIPFSISVSCDGTVSGCQVSPSNVFLAHEEIDVVTVTYSVGGGNTQGTIEVSAENSNLGYSDIGDIGVQTRHEYGVNVHLAAETLRPSGNQTVTQDFTVSSTSTTTVDYNLVADCDGPAVVSCSADENSISLGPDASTSVGVTYQTGDPGESGQLSLRATQVDSAEIKDTDEAAVDIPHVYTVSVTSAAGGSTSTTDGAHLSHDFVVTNDGSTLTHFSLSTSCDGTVVDSCTIASQDSLALAAGESDTAEVEFDVSGTPGSMGQISVTAERSSDDSVTDTGTLNVNVVEGIDEAPSVSVSGLNPGTTLQRDLCLTASLPSGGIAECGDLRLIHSLPSTRTFNKLRTPRLIYSSQHAAPHPVVKADVTFSDSAATPEAVTAVLRLDGVQVAQATWPDSVADWASRQTRRIAVDFDATDVVEPGEVAGLYDYELEVTAEFDSTTATADAASGELVIVDRSQSPFGAGWWLAGWERLRFYDGGSTILWVGGDGSTRKYTEVIAGSVWAAPSHERPDTLKKVGGQYVRELPGGVDVRFSQNGVHVATENRLGHTTTFSDTAGVLTGVSLPVPASAPARDYTIVYASGVLDSIAAPTVGGTSRDVDLTTSGGRIVEVRDPDGRSVQFGYDGNHVTSRTDRRGTVTQFDYDVAARVDSAHLFMAAGTSPTPDDIVVTLRNPTAQISAPAATAPDSVYLLLDGPRVGSVADTTAFYLDRFGQPARVRDALGHETILKRTDARFPGLVTSVAHPSGQVIEAYYNARGLPDSVKDLATYDPAKGYATTRYEWHPTWPSPTRITRPEGDFVTMGYTSVGNRDWRQDARGNRVEYLYHQSGDFAGMASGVQLPDRPASAFAYDVFGNLKTTTTPKDFTTTYVRDSVGRDTLVKTPIDGTKVQKQRTEYDIMGRPTLTETIGPAMNGAVEQTVSVETVYDAAGAPDTVRRSMSPDTAEIGVMETVSWYDAAGRVIKEQAPDGKQDSTVYDPAGNVVARHTRRGNVITMVYDALNRLRARYVPSFTYPKRFEGIPHYRRLGTNIPHHDHPPYPRYPNTSGGGLKLAAYVDTFTYDPMGNVRTADNPFAKVLRTYNSNGTLESETLRVRTVAPVDSGGDFSTHVYTTEFAYDLSGRRTDLIHPNQLVGSADDRTTYEYGPDTGLLETVTDPMGNAFTYHYNAQSQPDSLYLPGGLREGYEYDNDGRLKTHRVINESSSPYAYIDTELRNTTLHYDQRNKVVRTDNLVGTKDTLRADYSGLGHLVEDSLTSRSTTIGGDTVRYVSTETFTYDPLGNQKYSLSDWSMVSLTGPGEKNGFGGGSYDYVPDVGRVASRSIGTWRTDVYEFDAAGNEVFVTTDSSYAYWTSQDPKWEDRASFYDALGHLRVVEKRDIQDVTKPSTGFSWTYEEHRYDALGRRIWSRARRGCNDQYHSFSDQCRLDFVRRFVWEGEQELWEIQMPGGDSTAVDTMENDVDPVMGPPVTHNFADTDSHFGRVLYTHGLALDRPLGVVRFNYADRQGSSNPYFVWSTFTIVPLWNHRGQPDLGTFGDGGANHCRQIDGETRCVQLEWPAGWSAYAKNQYATDIRDFWHGSLLEDKKDYAGTFYRRNRYYDPATGRFTQEDPIGLAGGLNLYGFAGGDPVNLSDPFGLCPPEDTNVDDCPDNVVGNALRLIDAYGGNLGESTIEAMVDYGIEVQVVDKTPCPGGRNSCYSRESSDIYVGSPGSASDMTWVIGHEVEHAIQGRQVPFPLQEGYAYRRATGLYGSLPSEMQADSYKVRWVGVFQRNPTAAMQYVCTYAAREFNMNASVCQY